MTVQVEREITRDVPVTVQVEVEKEVIRDVPVTVQVPMEALDPLIVGNLNVVHRVAFRVRAAPPQLH